MLSGFWWCVSCCSLKCSVELYNGFFLLKRKCQSATVELWKMKIWVLCFFVCCKKLHFSLSSASLKNCCRLVWGRIATVWAASQAITSLSREVTLNFSPEPLLYSRTQSSNYLWWSVTHVGANSWISGLTLLASVNPRWHVLNLSLHLCFSRVSNPVL